MIGTRTAHLASIALQAEKLRLQRRVKRIIARGAAGAAGVAFLLFALGLGHVAGYQALLLRFAPYWAALIVAGCDVLLALMCLLFTGVGAPDPTATEAKHVRDDALHQLRNNLAITAALRPLSRVGAKAVSRKPLAGLAIAALATGLLKRS